MRVFAAVMLVLVSSSEPIVLHKLSNRTIANSVATNNEAAGQIIRQQLQSQYDLCMKSCRKT